MERDPVYEYLFMEKIEPFVERARMWWDGYEKEVFYGSGTYPLLNSPDGLYIRFYRTPAHSPIKGIQAFPYVTTQYIDIQRVPGGLRKFLHQLCLSGYKYKEFTLIEKMYLHGTERSGQFICIVPTNMLSVKNSMGRYVWMTPDDISNISLGIVTEKMRDRFMSFSEGNLRSPTKNFV